MQLRILYPKLFTSYYDFVEKFCSYEKTPYGNKVHGAKYPDVVRRMLKNFAIGRSYKEAGLELPDLIEHVISVTMPPGLMVRYKEVKTGYVLEDIPLDYMIQVMQILRRMTLCNEKIEALLNTIQDNDAFDAVIFTWYRETAEAIGKVLNIPVITGDMPAETRIKTAKESDMVVATISSLSEGVDLSKSRNVVFFETDYTYGIMHQAVSRVRRYSADNTPINVFYIMMKNTIDETVYRKSKMRGATVKEILREEING